MGDGSPLLVVEHLSRVVQGKVIVEDVSFEASRGEVLAITGPSGSGKSSLLRLINRLDEPTGGTVYLEGIDYRLIPPRELRRRVGMVTQTAYLFPGTVAGNIRFGPRQQGRELSDDVVEELLERVGLRGMATAEAGYLSGGEAQRVSFARALANSPAALLLDEPTSALDEDSKRGIEALILEIVRRSGIACVMVTHDLARAVRVARRAMVLRAGRLVRAGSVQEVLDAQGDVR
jgi:putative ABC transport system ATP-binding protein